MIIEIITQVVEMPSLENRRYQKICTDGNNKWETIDTHNQNKTIQKGNFENTSLACHNLNKKFYRDNPITNLIL